MGPVITCAARDRIVGLIDRGVAEGATLVVDGRKPSGRGARDGFFVGPTLFDHARPEMAIYREEIFGPVLIVVRVESLDAAIALINANPYANGAALFTRSGYAARRFQQDAEIGMIGINVPIPVPMAFYSFGGWRNSLFGDLHVHGMDGVRFYTRGKAVTTRWPDDGSAAPGFTCLRSADLRGPAKSAGAEHLGGSRPTHREHEFHDDPVGHGDAIGFGRQELGLVECLANGRCEQRVLR